MQSSKQEIINLGNGLFLLGKQTPSPFFLAFPQGIRYTEDMGEKEKKISNAWGINYKIIKYIIHKMGASES